MVGRLSSLKERKLATYLQKNSKTSIFLNIVLFLYKMQEDKRTQEIEKIKQILDNTHRPLILFDSDPDGLCSFLMIYKYINEGKGICVKSSKEINTEFLRVIQEYGPDRVIILDMPMVNDEFISKIKTDILWIDHHQIPDNHNKMTYFNPLLFDEKDNSPTSYWIYKILNEKKYLWLSMTGCIADWHIPAMKKEFIKEYPELFSAKITNPAKALFETKIGRLAKMFDSCLKGTSKQIKTNIKILTRIQEPNEILEQETAKGKFIHKYFTKINNQYEEILSRVDTTDKKIIAFHYKDDKTAVTSMLSNELQHLYPKRFIAVCREKSSHMNCSLRSQVHDVRALLEKILPQFEEGTGGGHMHACGASIRAVDYNDFIARIKQEMDDFRVQK